MLALFLLTLSQECDINMRHCVQSLVVVEAALGHQCGAPGLRS